MECSNQKQIECFRARTTVPKYLFQGNLFAVSKRSQCIPSKDTRIKTLDNSELIVSCEGFTQFDLAVSLAYKKIINANKNFDDIYFTISDFARALNRNEGGKTRKLILEAFVRSNNFHLSLKNKSGQEFDGYRLKKFEEVQNNKFRITFNLDYLTMAYEENEVCNIDMEIFLNLRPGLQSWLYGFICSISGQCSIDLDLLHDLSGSNYKNRGDFKKAIKEALTILYKKGILGWRHGVSRDNIVYWEYLDPCYNSSANRMIIYNA